MQSRGLIHGPLTKMNDSSLSEAPLDHHQFSTKFHSGCETLWLAVQVLGKADNWTHKMNLLQSSTVQSLWSFANLSLTLLCFSLMKGFCLALHNSSPASMSLSRTILSVHFTPAVCHYFFSWCHGCWVTFKWVGDHPSQWRVIIALCWSLCCPQCLQLDLILMNFCLLKFKNESNLTLTLSFWQ